MKIGDREFRSRIAHLDHIALIEGWTGWEVVGHHQHVEAVSVAPFASKADAVAWLRSWGFTQPLRCVELGSWHWSQNGGET